jgi:hypothetical protein
MLAVELERTVQFPRLPLANTVILTGTENQHNRVGHQKKEQNRCTMRGMFRTTALPALACLLAFALCGPFAAPQASGIGDDEYAVYAALLDSFQSSRKSSHPIVADQTATFACHAACNGLTIGGCNGLRQEDETPAQRLAIVRRDIPDLSSATTGDFESKNQSCTPVAPKLPTKVKYIMSLHEGDDMPEGWDDPDYFFFSRVAFNADHTQALVVLGFMSGTHAKDSEGKYFLLIKRPGGWALHGTSLIWQLQPGH